jgi:chromosome partitioning protein
MKETIAISNQKGGVGKTTTAINLSTYLALSDKRVLLIDIDPQGNATSGIGIDKNRVTKSIYQVILQHVAILDAVCPTSIENLSIIPSNVALTGAEVELVNVTNREQGLRNAIASVEGRYDFILIDCPPSLGLLTVNALSASDSVLIPVQCEYYALEGLGQLLATIDLVRRNINPSLEIEGIVLTMADFRTKLTEEVTGEIRDFFKEKVYRTIIPRSIRLSEAPGFGKPIALYDGNSIGAQRYKELCEELLGRRAATGT